MNHVTHVFARLKCCSNIILKYNLYKICTCIDATCSLQPWIIFCCSYIVGTWDKANYYNGMAELVQYNFFFAKLQIWRKPDILNPYFLNLLITQ